MSNAEWLEKLRKKEEEHQRALSEINRRNNEEMRDLESKHERKIADLKKDHAKALEEKEEEMTHLKKKELKALDEKKENEKKEICKDYE